jgi:hypothetical protein
MTTRKPKPAKSGGIEGAIEVVILIVVAVMAGAASFTHVHDWTMDNAPAGTGSWFGWANAMVSELIPLAAGLEARRRRAAFGHAGKYPVFLILAAVALSLTGQFGEAKPSISGWIISAVPALGFLALVKLVLSRPTGPAHQDAQGAPEHATTAPAPPATTPTPITAPAPAQPRPITPEPIRRPASMPANNNPPATIAEPVSVPAHLLPSARFAATNHQATTGRPITSEELAARISVPPAVAGQLLTLVNQPGTTPARINGHAITGGAR